MSLKTVVGSLVLNSISAADWTVEVLSCEYSPQCQEAVSYVPGQTFSAAVMEWRPGAIFRYQLLLDVTNTTTLKFLSAGVCSCPLAGHFSCDLGYTWVAEECYFSGVNCVYEEIIEVQPGSYSIYLDEAGYFSISNTKPTPEPVAGDFDGDGDLDVDDYSSIGTSLGLCASDTNRDSIVDFSDLLMVINDWGATCE